MGIINFVDMIVLILICASFCYVYIKFISPATDSTQAKYTILTVFLLVLFLLISEMVINRAKHLNQIKQTTSEESKNFK